jgi:Protein of unknown function (DUF2721)
MEMTLATPALLFPAISLLLLAYTNRFLAIANLARKLKEQYLEEHKEGLLPQIANLRKRIFLIRNMQLLGVFALFLCVLSMFMIYEMELKLAKSLFGIGLFSLTISLGLSMYEIVLSVTALNVDLKEIETELKKHDKNSLIKNIRDGFEI